PCEWCDTEVPAPAVAGIYWDAVDAPSGLVEVCVNCLPDAVEYALEDGLDDTDVMVELELHEPAVAIRVERAA
ncbi:hypothetical protein, partial [Longimycelium tulufanense]|uniref:hypothetical protein n=1 Tax=Longimycelium tulufanense TaxID=907463 RepID=UPI00166C3B47